MKLLIKQGSYLLYKTKKQYTILSLDTRTYIWLHAKNIGSILIKTSRKFTVDAKLASGAYRIFEVKNEPKLVDLHHLELEIGKTEWQGYLLPRGLPTSKAKKHRIIATKEVISTTSKPFDYLNEQAKIKVQY